MALSSLIPGQSQNENNRLKRPVLLRVTSAFSFTGVLGAAGGVIIIDEKKATSAAAASVCSGCDCHHRANWHKQASASGKPFNPCTCLGAVSGQRAERKRA